MNYLKPVIRYKILCALCIVIALVGIITAISHPLMSVSGQNLSIVQYAFFGICVPILAVCFGGIGKSNTQYNNKIRSGKMQLGVVVGFESRYVFGSEYNVYDIEGKGDESIRVVSSVGTQPVKSSVFHLAVRFRVGYYLNGEYQTTLTHEIPYSVGTTLEDIDALGKICLLCILPDSSVRVMYKNGGSHLLYPEVNV